MTMKFFLLSLLVAAASAGYNYPNTGYSSGYAGGYGADSYGGYSGSYDQAALSKVNDYSYNDQHMYNKVNFGQQYATHIDDDESGYAGGSYSQPSYGTPYSGSYNGQSNGRRYNGRSY